MAEHGALPKADFLSFTRAGEPWLNFEWLTQALFYGVFSRAGMAGLWILKGVFLALGAGALWALMGLQGLSPAAQAFGIAWWAAGGMAHADIRPDVISVFFFALTLWGLEAWRLQKIRFNLASAAAVAAAFGAWSNFHAGFVFGLGLIAFYLFEPRRGELAKFLACAALGSLLNPYGAGPHLVALRHLAERSEISQYIQEWQPVTFANAFHWPYFAQAAVFVAALALGWRKGFPRGLAAAALAFGLAGGLHARLASYFNVLAAASLAPLLVRPAAGRWLPAGAGAVALYLGFALSKPAFGSWFDPRFIPQNAAEFMARHRPTLEPLRVYNPWEWGGYLGFRLSPWHKVFGDGRYIFHDQLGELAAAVTSPEECAKFLERHDFDAALMRNVDALVHTTRSYPDGSSKAFRRPWYWSYLPKDRWALVYWDDQALLFARRDRVPAAWLAQREFRYFRPKDEEALADALSRGEVPGKAVRDEERRHRLDLVLYTP